MCEFCQMVKRLVSTARISDTTCQTEREIDTVSVSAGITKNAWLFISLALVIVTNLAITTSLLNRSGFCCWKQSVKGRKSSKGTVPTPHGKDLLWKFLLRANRKAKGRQQFKPYKLSYRHFRCTVDRPRYQSKKYSSSSRTFFFRSPFRSPLQLSPFCMMTSV